MRAKGKSSRGSSQDPANQGTGWTNKQKYWTATQATHPEATQATRPVAARAIPRQIIRQPRNAAPPTIEAPHYILRRPTPPHQPQRHPISCSSLALSFSYPSSLCPSASAPLLFLHGTSIIVGPLPLGGGQIFQKCFILRDHPRPVEKKIKWKQIR